MRWGLLFPSLWVYREWQLKSTSAQLRWKWKCICLLNISFLLMYVHDCILYLWFSGRDPLPWSTRVKVALDSARGLEYIHENTVPVYIHRDIKSANILIDKNFRGKVCLFWHSRPDIIIIILNFFGTGCRFWANKIDWIWKCFAVHTSCGYIWIHGSRVGIS